MLSGPDGTGKSTIANAVIRRLNESNNNVSHVWLRFNHYSAKFINMVGRVIGKSYYETYSWGKLGYHDYSGFIGVFYIIAVYIDHLIFNTFFRKRHLKPNKNYLIDRFIIDIIADLIVDTNKTNMILLLFGPFLKKELKVAHAFILICDKEIVYSRRVDIIDDKRYDAKINAYKLIAIRFNITTVNSGVLSIDEFVSKIIDFTN